MKMQFKEKNIYLTSCKGHLKKNIKIINTPIPRSFNIIHHVLLILPILINDIKHNRFIKKRQNIIYYEIFQSY